MSAIDILFYLAIIAFVLRAVHGSVLFLYIAVASGMGVFGYYALSNVRAGTRFWLLFGLFACAYVTTMAVNAFGDGWLFFPLYLSAAGIAWRLHLKGISFRFTWALFYLAAADFLVEAYVLGRNVHTIFGNSGNHISVTFICLATLLYIAASRNGRPRTLLPAVVTFIISVLALGVGGIISSTVMLVGIVLLRFGQDPRFKPIVGALAIAGGILIVVKYETIRSTIEEGTAAFYLNSGDLATIVDPEGDLARKLDPELGLAANDRYKIWQEYMASLDADRIFAGSPISTRYFGYANLHNSYLLLHARAGVWTFGILAIFLYSLVIVFRRDRLLFVCLLAILVRAYSDTVFFGLGNYDWLVLYVMLFAPPYRERSWMAKSKRLSVPPRRPARIAAAPGLHTAN